MLSQPFTTPLGITSKVCLCIVAAIVFIYLAAPVLVVLPLSFNSEPYFSYPMPGVSLRWYREVLASEAWGRAAVNSFGIAIVATSVSMVLGSLAAFGLNRRALPCNRLISSFMIAPLIVPTIITAIGVFFLFAQLHLLGTYVAIVLSHSVLAIPYVVLTLNATLSGLDMDLLRAGASLGAPPLRTFVRIALPLITPGFIAAGLFAFVVSFDEAVIVLFLAGPQQHTLPIEMWKGVRESLSPAILAVACLLAAGSFVTLLCAELLRRRAQRLRGGDA